MAARILENGDLEHTPGKRVCYRIQPWGKGLSIASRHHGQWRPARLPIFALLVPSTEQAEDKAVRRFIADIPLNIRDAARPYTGFGQALMLQWAAKWQPARDLLHSNPHLLWLLVIALYEGNISHDDFPDILGLKQRQILGRALWATSTKPRLRLLAKIKLDEASLSEGRLLLKMLQESGVISVLQHCPTVPISLLGLYHQRPALIQPGLPRLLTDWADKTTLDDFLVDYVSINISAVPAAELYLDAMRIAQDIGIERPERALVECRTLAGLQKLHDRWLSRADYPSIKVKTVTHVMFPPAPLPDTSVIRAIRTLAGLRAESRRMSNCVSSYASSILNGECSIYRVLEPERGTLEVVRNRDGELALGQFKLARNQPPSVGSWALVRNWFEACTAPDQ